ncbi:MAG: sigma-70 family RNA polymerase sigma factor [Microthrixaceae bacterium]
MRSSAFGPLEELSDDAQVALWVEAAQEGDEAAFQELVASSYRDVFTLALRLCRSEEDALDVTQEAYLRCYRSLGSFRGDSKFSTWMYRITANCASTYLKKRSRHRHESIEDQLEPADAEPSRDPVGRAENTELRSRLDGALGTLAPKLRAVVVLRDIYDLSHEDIASELGISVSASKVRLHRARHQLRDSLLPDVVVASHDL